MLAPESPRDQSYPSVSNQPLATPLLAPRAQRLESLLAQAGRSPDEQTGSISCPIYQTATFRHPGLGQSTGYDYSRTANPTRAALEALVARLEGGDRAFAFASGMAAITAVLLAFPPGAHLRCRDVALEMGDGEGLEAPVDHRFQAWMGPEQPATQDGVV